MTTALACFAALSQETRLETLKLLVRAGDDGLPAGEIARQLDIGSTLLSAHLSKLSNAGLVTSRRDGRSIIYRADYGTLRELLQFLMADCCSGSPAIVGDLDLTALTQGAS
ncbi:helix-turn-helix transcriptional regulator [Erythrobacter sp. NAP1]|uniref:ArsR/SmtB family transcription factor n=1 Tax=Erythrobacter sp. NAP1 TaxID=237727 RepID=UPI001F51BF7E|nr:metalloregulator ArsR/SmtB family transcription factor [Erythrobacter sp. NAP1]